MRVRMAHGVLGALAQSVSGVAPIMLGVLGPLVLAALAALVLPLFYATTLSWPAAVGVFTLQTVVGALPVVLLRAQLLPNSLMRWAQSLPVSNATLWLGDAGAVGTCMVPLALAYAVSSLVWVAQSPRWLQGQWTAAFYLVALSWLASNAMGLAALRIRWHAAHLHGDAVPSRVQVAARSYGARFRWTLHPIAVQTYHLLLLRFLRERSWLWHALQATWLFLAVVFWDGLWQGSVPAVHVVAFSLAIVAWTHWRTGVATLSLHRLTQALVGYPIHVGGLKRVVRVWAVLPAASTATGAWAVLGLAPRPAPGLGAYTACLLLGACTLAWVPTRNARERWAVVVAWLVGLILVGANG